jgi:hypothetical protein
LRRKRSHYKDGIDFEYRDAIFKLLRSPGIDCKESIPQAYEASGLVYDNPVSTRFLAPIPIDKIPAQKERKKKKIFMTP